MSTDTQPTPVAQPAASQPVQQPATPRAIIENLLNNCAGDPGECAFNGACMYACGSQPVQQGPNDTQVSARFARLYGIVRRLRWTDYGVPAVAEDMDSAQALIDLCEFLLADGMDAAISPRATQAGEHPTQQEGSAS